MAEKHRLVPDVEPCKGQGPRCWALRAFVETPSSCRTAAMVTAARTAAKSMAGRGGGADDADADDVDADDADAVAASA